MNIRCRILLVLFSCVSVGVHAQTFRYEIHDDDLIPPHVYKERRERLLSMLPAKSVAILFAADVRNRQNDVDYEYRQNSNLLYLTGCIEPGSALVLVPSGVRIGNRTFREILFLRQRNPSAEQWQGVMMGPEEALQHLRPDTALVVTRLTEIVDSIIRTATTVYTPGLPTRSVSVPLAGSKLLAETSLREWLWKRDSSIVLKTSLPQIATMREVKDTAELRLLQRAIDISIDGHTAMMKGARPGMKEYELEALVEFGFKSGGAEDVGYPSIVGSSYNACILHYTSNRRATKMNDMVLADCGAEYHGYTADITRTFPLSGRFTQDQRTIYDVVLEAQDSGIAASTSGAPFQAPHAAAERVITRRLLELGIIEKAVDVRLYFMHGTSHYLGLDVHDAGTGGPLKVNTVITVEPGIYIPEGSPCDRKWWNIGVRIEDDILITANGPVNMSGALPRTAAGIETLMRDRSN